MEESEKFNREVAGDDLEEETVGMGGPNLGLDDDVRAPVQRGAEEEEVEGADGAEDD